MRKKLGKEKKLLNNDYFRVKYGTVDAYNFESVYLIIQSWVQPTEITNFDSKISILRKKIQLELKSKIDKNFFKENIILDFDLRQSGIRLNKKSFMSIELTLYPKNNHKFSSETVKDKIYDVTNCVIDTIYNNNFLFHSKK